MVEPRFLDKGAATSAMRDTARAVTAALARHNIPHLVAGSLVVQEYGYPGVTLDVDIIVPDVLQAAKIATTDSTRHWARAAGVPTRLQDTRHGVIIDLRPAGKVLQTGCKVPFPNPTVVSDQLKFVMLEQLISLKLDSWSISPVRRLADKAHVVELMIRRELPRDLGIHLAVRDIYLETWDALQVEK